MCSKMAYVRRHARHRPVAAARVPAVPSPLRTWRCYVPTPPQIMATYQPAPQAGASELNSVCAWWAWSVVAPPTPPRPTLAAEEPTAQRSRRGASHMLFRRSCRPQAGQGIMTIKKMDKDELAPGPRCTDIAHNMQMMASKGWPAALDFCCRSFGNMEKVGLGSRFAQQGAAHRTAFEGHLGGATAATQGPAAMWRQGSFGADAEEAFRRTYVPPGWERKPAHRPAHTAATSAVRSVPTN